MSSSGLYLTRPIIHLYDTEDDDTHAHSLPKPTSSPTKGAQAENGKGCHTELKLPVKWCAYGGDVC